MECHAKSISSLLNHKKWNMMLTTSAGFLISFPTSAALFSLDSQDILHGMKYFYTREHFHQLLCVAEFKPS